MKKELEEEIKGEVVEEESVIKKFLIVVGAIFLIVLVMSFVIVTFPIGDIIQGKSESYVSENDTLVTGEFTITFENQTFENLSQMYFGEQRNEFSRCLLGYVDADKYFVTALYEPEVSFHSFSIVSFEPCPEETIIMLHTHPYKRCVASSTDLNTLKNAQKTNPSVLMMVMCEPNRFSVYS